MAELPTRRRKELAGRVRAIVLEELGGLEGQRVGVLLSSGVDSQLVLRALLLVGAQPVAFSFRVRGLEPRDWLVARETAAELGVPFRDVEMDSDLDALRGYVRWAVEHGIHNKAGIECFWPRRYAIDAAAGAVPVVATGDGGDGYHGLSKSAMIHYRDDVAKLDDFRRWYFDRPNWSQTASIRWYAGSRGLEVRMPLASPRLLEEVFLGLTWEEANKPRQKQLLREAFDLPALPPHQNLQLGDSGIAKLFERLTPEGARSPVSYYNRVAREAAEPRLF